MKKRVFLFLLTGLFFGLGCEKKESRPLEPGLMIEIVRASTGQTETRRLSFARIRSLPVDSVRARSKPDRPESLWAGLSVKRLLEEELDISMESVLKVEASASDGYMSVISGDRLPALTSALLAWKLDDMTEFPPKYGPVRLVMPTLLGMYWVNGPVKIRVETGEKAQAIHRMTIHPASADFFQTSIGEGRGTPRIPVTDLIDLLGGDADGFSVLSADGLFRDYAMNEVIRYMVLYQEEGGGWTIGGVNVPSGLMTRNIYFFISHHAGIFMKSPSAAEMNVWMREVWSRLGPDASVPLTVRDSEGRERSVAASELLSCFEGGRLEVSW